MLDHLVFTYEGSMLLILPDPCKEMQLYEMLGCYIGFTAHPAFRSSNGASLLRHARNRLSSASSPLILDES